MATIKSYSDLQQSKKLAEILPLESADMCYIAHSELIGIHEPFYKKIDKNDIPCWSLAALLGILPKVINNETLFIETSPALWHIGYRNIYTARADNPVDACVDMILRLSKNGLTSLQNIIEQLKKL